MEMGQYTVVIAVIFITREYNVYVLLVLQLVISEIELVIVDDMVFTHSTFTFYESYVLRRVCDADNQKIYKMLSSTRDVVWRRVG